MPDNTMIFVVWMLGMMACKRLVEANQNKDVKVFGHLLAIVLTVGLVRYLVVNNIFQIFGIYLTWLIIVLLVGLVVAKVYDIRKELINNR